MYTYEDLVLDDTGLFSQRLLTRTSRRTDSRTPGAFLEEGILTKLVTFARTRQHNLYPGRPTSICSVCCRVSESSRKCRRWNDCELPELSNDSRPTTLQPYCEVLGSFLCSDCSLERTKQNHLLHLPAIFGLEKDSNRDQREFSRRSRRNVVNRRTRVSDGAMLKSTFSEGIVARANTPHEWDDKESNCCVARPMRQQMEHLAMLPDILGERKYRLRKWMSNERKTRQKKDDFGVDLKNMLGTSLNSSVGKRLVDVNPRNIIALGSLKAPCITPKEHSDALESKSTKQLDVIELAQKLQDLYRERYLPFGKSDSLLGHGSVTHNSTLISSKESFPFDDGELERLFLEASESFVKKTEDFSFRKLTLSPATGDVQNSKRIQDNLIYNRPQGQGDIGDKE